MATVKFRELKIGTGQTTDSSTQVPMCTFDVSTGGVGGTAINNCSIFITARCSGYVPAAGTGAGEFIGGMFKVNSGTLSQIGAASHAIAMIKDTGGAPNSDFSVSGNVITYYVTGVAATTIEWFGAMEILVYEPV